MRGVTPWLMTKPALTTFMNYATIVIELLIGLAVLFYFRLPNTFKTGLAFFLVFFHLFIVAMIDVEPFIFYTSACALLLLPGSFWKRILKAPDPSIEQLQGEVYRWKNLYRVIVPIFIGLLCVADQANTSHIR